MLNLPPKEEEKADLTRSEQKSEYESVIPDYDSYTGREKNSIYNDALPSINQR